jgi:hypothetical protein
MSEDPWDVEAARRSGNVVPRASDSAARVTGGTARVLRVDRFYNSVIVDSQPG